MSTLDNIAPLDCDAWLLREGDERGIPVGAIEKAHLVLASFPTDRTATGVTDLSRRSGLAKSTTHRILQILETIGMVERRAEGYLLGYRLQELAEVSRGRGPSRLRDAVLPHLLDLYEETHLTIHLAVWSGPEVLIVERLHGRNGPGVPPPAGSKAPAQRTTLGRVLLAYADDLPLVSPATPARLQRELSTIRRQGVALAPCEFAPGVTSVAAPVRSSRQSVVAALSVSGQSGRLDLNATIRRVRRAAHAASSSRIR